MMAFIKKIFSFSFKGRAKRKECFFGVLLLLTGEIALSVCAPVVSRFSPDAKSAFPFKTLIGIVLCFLIIVVIINFWALLCRRMHDINHSGWYGFLMCIFAQLLGGFSSNSIFCLCFSILLTIYLVYIYFLKEGTSGPNRFGQIQDPENSSLR